MASASAPPVASTKETTNYARLCRLLVDVGTEALRETFDRIHPPAGLHLVLARSTTQTTLQSLRKKRILNPTQWGMLYPAIVSSVTSASFDITLLMVLLRNICHLTSPASGWDKLPSAADTSTEANIARVKYYRNTVYGHANQASVDDATFNSQWQDISNALVALGGARYGTAIHKLKNEAMDPDAEVHYKELLMQWKRDEDSSKEKLEDMEENLKETLEQMRHQMKNVSEKFDSLRESISDEDKLQQMKNETANINDKLDTLIAQRETDDEDKIRDDLNEIKREMRTISEKLKSPSTSGEENSRDNLEQMKNEIADIKEKLDTLINRLPQGEKKLRMEDDFDPAEIIDRIRELYKVREGWLAPFPWCEEFHFHLDSLFTRLKVVSRKKTRGTATDNIVNMSGVFKPHEECPQPRTVLIEGKPGMGKTTYCQKMVYDWATGKLKAEDRFPSFETVLLLKCRDIKSDLWEAIDDQLLPRGAEEDSRKSFFSSIRQNQSSVLLVLDGLDEVPPSELPVFTEIIQGRRELPKCRVVATSRHEAGMQVRKHCDSLLQIEGFTDEDAEEFIFKYFKDMKNLAEELLSKLRSDKNLKDMAANPLNTALLCLICAELEGTFPKTKTQLYVEIIQCILRRYRKKKGLPETNEDLIEVYDAQLKHLGQIALNGLLEDNLEFEESELKSHADELPEFGFLSIQTGSSKRRPRRHFSFLHKSFQECFAAIYLRCQLLNKEISVDMLAADRKYLQELKEVLSFTCGMVAARCKETAEALIKSITVQVNEAERQEKGFIKECFVALLASISECRRDDNSFHLQMARACGSLLKRKELYLDDYIISEGEVVLLGETLKINSTLTKLDLSFNTIGDQGATGLAEALKINSTLRELNLRSNEIGDQGATGLAEVLKNNSTLTSLDLEENAIGDQGATGLAEALKINSTLTVLHLDGNAIGDQGATGLAKALKINLTLTVLYLGDNGISNQGATGLAEALKINSTLTSLYLEHNVIGEEEAIGLAEALKINSTLTRLDLKRNVIGGQGATGLAEALKIFSTLTELDLGSNAIRDQGAIGLAEALKRNSTLRKLDLRSNEIDDQGATGLAEALKTNSTLTELYLCSNVIGDQGATGLAEALKINATLTTLHLDENTIGDHGATGLAEAVGLNSTLVSLQLRNNYIGETVLNKLRGLRHRYRLIWF